MLTKLLKMPYNVEPAVTRGRIDDKRENRKRLIAETRQVTEKVNIGPRNKQNVLKRNKFNCFKIQQYQEIFPDDNNFKRMEYCEIITNRHKGNLKLFKIHFIY